MSSKDRPEIKSGESPLGELYALAKGDSALRKELEQWEKKWIVQYAVEDDVQDVLSKAQNEDDLVEALATREQGVMQWLGSKLAQDCALFESENKSVSKKHRYSLLGIRKQKV